MRSLLRSGSAHIHLLVDLVVREGTSLDEAISSARQIDAPRRDAGYDQAALNAAGKAGFGHAAFEDSDEELISIVEDFF